MCLSVGRLQRSTYRRLWMQRLIQEGCLVPALVSDYAKRHHHHKNSRVHQVLSAVLLSVIFLLCCQQPRLPCSNPCYRQEQQDYVSHRARPFACRACTTAVKEQATSTTRKTCNSYCAIHFSTEVISFKCSHYKHICAIV